IARRRQEHLLDVRQRRGLLGIPKEKLAPARIDLKRLAAPVVDVENDDLDRLAKGLEHALSVRRVRRDRQRGQLKLRRRKDTHPARIQRSLAPLLLSERDVARRLLTLHLG